jgi:hypothetical protein
MSLNAPLAEPGTDILAFWKANEFNFPVLFQMAKDYLTVQARLFVAGYEKHTSPTAIAEQESRDSNRLWLQHLGDF